MQVCAFIILYLSFNLIKNIYGKLHGIWKIQLAEGSKTMGWSKSPVIFLKKRRNCTPKQQSRIGYNRLALAKVE